MIRIALVSRRLWLALCFWSATRRRDRRQAKVCLALCVAAAALGGCGSAPPASVGHGADPSLLESDLTATSDLTREVAALHAGVNAFHLGELEDAERSLTVAAASSDPDTAARGEATLGLVRLEQDRLGDAARLFAAASSRLAAIDGTAIATPAAAERRHGDGASGGGSGIGAGVWPRQIASSIVDPTAFALQAGAFRTRARADQVVSDLQDELTRTGLGTAHVVPRQARSGERLHAVRFGQFASRAAAVEARTRLGRPQFIVVPTPGSVSAAR